MDDDAKLDDLAAAEKCLFLCDRNIANQRAMLEELERGGELGR
jgi:hypothetical protein